MSDEIDLEALEKHVQESLNETEEVAETEEISEVQEEVAEIEEEQEAKEAFDLDAAINSTEPVNLKDKITEEVAIEKAKERGWNEDGVDKFGNRISAIEFLERTPFFRKIERMHHDIDNQNKRIEELAEQNKKIAQKSVEDKKRLNTELKDAKEKLLNAEYLDTEDVAKLKDLDSKIEATTTVEAEDTEVQLSETDQKLADDWDVAKAQFVKDNDWYESDYKMTKMADDVGVAYVNNYLNTHKALPPPEEAFAHAISEVKKAFPSIEKKRQTRVATTQHRTVVSQINKKKTLQDIPEDSRGWAKEVMEAADLTEEEFFKTYQI